MSEGWSLLPLLNSMTPGALAGIYRHEFCAQALRDIVGTSPAGMRDYYAAVRAFWQELHIRRFPNAEYVVDKTPPYSVHVDELMEIFPDAYHIIMWRNPLPVIASFIRSGGKGRFVLPKIEREIFLGLPRLVNASRRTDRKILCVRYEDLCTQYDGVLSQIWRFLGVPEGEPLADLKDVSLIGQLGDPGPLREAPAVRNTMGYGNIDELNGQIRKEFVRKVIVTLGRARLESMGYDYGQILREISDCGMAPLRTVADMWFYGAHLADRLLNVRFTFRVISMRKKGRQVSPLG